MILTLLLGCVLRVVSIACVLDFFPIITCPLRKTRDRLKQAAPEFCQVVFDAWRDGGIDGPGNQAVPFQAFQGQGQHTLGDAFDAVSQLTEALLPVAQHTDDLNAPFVAHPIQDFTNGGALGGNMLVTR